MLTEKFLLSLCSEHNHVVTNTIFKHKDTHKTWMHTRSKHWHLLDYIIIRQRDIMDVLDMRATRGADCGTDHVMLKTRLRVCRQKQHCRTAR